MSLSTLGLVLICKCLLCIIKETSPVRSSILSGLQGNEYLDSLKGRSHQAAISFWLVSTSSDGELCRLDMGQADGGVMVD